MAWREWHLLQAGGCERGGVRRLGPISWSDGGGAYILKGFTALKGFEPVL